ncbi:MAG: hypothetical protein AB7F98_04030 [Novosphingobium sp.]
MKLTWPWRKKRGMFTLQPQWKEMMIVTGPGGSFTLDFPMGIPTVVLPDEERWQHVAPDWARDHWRELKAEIQDWCRSNNARLEIDPKAGVY